MSSGQKHVVMFVRNPFTHDARVTREAAALAKAGHRVTVLAVRGEPSLPAREEIQGFTVERLSAPGPVYASLRSVKRRNEAPSTEARVRPAAPQRRGLARDLAIMAARTFSTIRFNLVAARRARALGAHVYHAHDFNALYGALSAARRSQIPVVYDSHELYAHLNVAHPTRARTAIVEALEGRWIRRARAVITVGDAIADHLARRYGITRPTVVMNIPDVTLPDGPVVVPDAFEYEGVKLLYVGGIQRARGLEQAIQAMSELPRMRLIVMGPAIPGEMASLRERAARSGLSDRVVFVPPVRHGDVVRVSSGATLALIPLQDVGLSYRLTIPNKLFEAINAGLPVVASDLPEMRRIVRENDIGELCDASDPRSLARAVLALTSNPARLEQVRANVRRAAARYTWAAEEKKLLDLYQTL